MNLLLRSLVKITCSFTKALILIIIFISGCIKNYVDVTKINEDENFSTNIENVFGGALRVEDADIETQRREKLINNLYKYVNERTGTLSADVILQLDLLNVATNEYQFQYCPISPIKINFFRKNISSYNLEQFLKQIKQKIEKIDNTSEELQELIAIKCDKKIQYLSELVDELDINSNFGGLKKIKQLSNSNNIIRTDVFSVIDEDYEQINYDLLEKKLDIVKSMSSIAENLPLMHPMPGSKLVSHYGYKFDPIKEKMIKQNGMKFIYEFGGYIYAPGKGQVSKIGPFEDKGTALILDHGEKIISIFYPIESFNNLVTIGDEVNIMDKIGTQEKEQHISYEIRVNNKPVDPRIFLKASRECHY